MGNDSRNIKTVVDLRAIFPVLTGQLERQVLERAARRVEAEAVKAERQRILSLAAIHFGQRAADKFSRVVTVFDPPPDPATERQRKEIAMFEKQVAEYMQRHNCKTSEAMSAVARKNPKAHEEYIERAQAGKNKSIRKVAVRANTFEGAVRELRKHKKCSASEAIQETIKYYPELHADYLNRLRNGEKTEPLK